MKRTSSILSKSDANALAKIMKQAKKEMGIAGSLKRKSK
jgi:hypothetical protein